MFFHWWCLVRNVSTSSGTGIVLLCSPGVSSRVQRCEVERPDLQLTVMWTGNGAKDRSLYSKGGACQVIREGLHLSAGAAALRLIETFSTWPLRSPTTKKVQLVLALPPRHAKTSAVLPNVIVGGRFGMI